jgi:hypothetical protein
LTANREKKKIIIKKKQKIILSACCAGVVTRQAHHTTLSPKGLGFLNVIYLEKENNNRKKYHVGHNDPSYSFLSWEFSTDGLAIFGMNTVSQMFTN